VVTQDGPHPPVELGAAATWRTTSFWPAVPPVCHKQRSRAVSSGQSRSHGEDHRAGRRSL